MVRVIQYCLGHLEEVLVVVPLLVLVVPVPLDHFLGKVGEQQDDRVEEVLYVPVVLFKFAELGEPPLLHLEDLDESRLFSDDDLLVRELVVQVDPVDEQDDLGFQLGEASLLLQSDGSGIEVPWQEVVVL